MCRELRSDPSTNVNYYVYLVLTWYCWAESFLNNKSGGSSYPIESTTMSPWPRRAFRSEDIVCGLIRRAMGSEDIVVPTETYGGIWSGV